MYHYLLKCEKYKQQRKRLFKRLRNIDRKFKNVNRIQLIDLIFPHLWQPKYYKENDEYYREKNAKNIRVRIEIFKQIIKFTKETKRFNGKYGE